MIIGGYGDRVSVRGWGLLVLAAAIGVAGGYAYADSGLALPAAHGTPTPVAASDPAFPSTPVEDLDPESDLPALPTRVEMRTATLGKPPLGIRFPVPADWPSYTIGDGTQVRFTAPGNPEAAYSVRVALLQTTQSPAQMSAARRAALPLDTRITDLGFDPDANLNPLIFDYVLNRHRVEQVVRWVSFNGGPAAVEIAASGRLIDDPGMRALVDTIAAGVERQPPRPVKPSGKSSASGTASPN